LFSVFGGGVPAYAAIRSGVIGSTPITESSVHPNTKIVALESNEF